MSLKKEIAEEFARASASFVRIGYLLRKAEDSEGYKNDGYDSLAEWAKAELGLTATYVSRFTFTEGRIRCIIKQCWRLCDGKVERRREEKGSTGSVGFNCIRAD